jgi:hypothetical protein
MQARPIGMKTKPTNTSTGMTWLPKISVDSLVCET